ncbi:MAG: putative DNA-binding domain-containing protein [Myxococcales bacterium]|nr:putative DNA-binding domain-containing protein [Myxococcales bacterium]
MKLADFYAQMGPFLLGKASHEETIAALFGENPPQPDADRVQIYGRFCLNHRHEVLDGIFTELRALIVHRCGESGWAQVVAAYFDAHPMHHFELNHNAEAFPAFLTSVLSDSCHSLRALLPDCAAELADFEWWEWQTFSALDVPSDTPIDAGPLRLHSSVDIRPYQYDWLDFLDRSQDARPELPVVHSSLVLFWRDRKLSARRASLSALELQLIKAIYEGRAVSDELAKQLGVSIEDLAEVAWDHHRAGILLGDPSLLP